MVQPKNYLHTVMQSFSICCLISCIWMIFGYSLAFRPGTVVIGGPSRFWLLGMEVWSIHPLAPTIPESVFMARWRVVAACSVLLIEHAPGSALTRRRRCARCQLVHRRSR